MKHLDGCNFIEIIENLNKRSWQIDEGEISGSIDISEREVHFSDGWGSWMPITFNYCPICGEKL